MTGNMYNDGSFTFRGAGGTYDQRPHNGTVYSKGFRHTVNTASNFYAIAPVDESGTADFNSQLRFDGATGKLTVKEFKVLTDDTATLTLTSDATNNNGSYLPMAYKRGNTVTLRMAVTRNVGSTGAILTTLPSNMRPPMLLINKVIALDGTPIDIEISTAGAVQMWSAGKSFSAVITFAVD